LLADLLERLGDSERIASRPPPALATEADVLVASGAAKAEICELIDWRHLGGDGRLSSMARQIT